MRRVIFWVLIIAMLVVPVLLQAQGDSLPQAEIDRISHSVVLIVTLDGDEPIASGSGTIMTPNGQIYTNRHVVEDGDDFAILLIQDIGEQPVLRYYATPTLIHDELDLAVLQIDRDENGRRIDSNTLNLPFIEMSGAAPNIGSRIFVFGFPDIGDGYLVLTSGSITTIQNGNLSGERMPLWYQTDAQISPGNSGGLAVNSEGRMIGIPTAVRSEERTLGRLGGILTASAIQSALNMAVAAVPTLTAPQIDATTSAPNVPPPDEPTGERALTIDLASVEHNVTQDGAIGMLVHTSVHAIGYRGIPLRAAIFMFWDDGSPMLASTRTALVNRTDQDQLTSQQILTPGFDDTVYDDAWFFLPYDLFPEGESGSRGAYVEAQVGVDGADFTAFSGRSTFDYTFPDTQLVVNLTRIEHNATQDGLAGMKVYGYVNAIGYRGVPIRVALFLYWEDGTPIPGSNAPVDFQTTDGGLTVQDVVTPSYDNSEWTEFWFFVPYDYFPGGLTGVQDAYAQLELGLDGETFSTWSFTESFQLNYD
ncbi:MAG: trypsin-like peptidase domain-containing protein [Chloroflexi bacterium]|nr:trypsin-like peptidase domain-containing protein [Chloroflexota bacterium]